MLSKLISWASKTALTQEEEGGTAPTHQSKPSRKGAKRKALVNDLTRCHVGSICSFAAPRLLLPHLVQIPLSVQQQKGETPKLWRISSLTQLVKLLFMIPVLGGGEASFSLGPLQFLCESAQSHWFPLQPLSEIYIASTGLLKYSFLSFLDNNIKSIHQFPVGKHCREHL